ncbi:MAG: YceI family protein [Mucilaginibacter sp.]|uniref:YceI family protein n=1 Tax=Mucilaginibacter sp. TaxID=1882438 RepID=UPI0031A09E38
MKKIYVIALLALLCSSSFAQVKTSITKSAITFKIKNLGLNTNGNFSGLQADIQFKPTDLAGSSINASVDATTVNTDNTMRDDHLKGTDYFNVATYPKITLKSVSFKHTKGDNYLGNFNVTIKDKTKLIEVPFTYTEAGNTASFNGSFKINRSDFGIGGKNMVLSNEATVEVNAEISK